MSLILNGTDGLSDVDGSASTPAIRGTDTNTGIFFPSADTIAFAEGGAEVARFNSSGNLGIGTTSPGAPLQARGANILSSGSRNLKGWIGGASSWGSNSSEELGVGYSGIRSVYTGGDNWALTFASGTSTEFSAGTQPERMRLDSNGDLLVGATSGVAGARLLVEKSVADNIVRMHSSGATPYGLLVRYTGTSPNNSGQEFLYCLDTATLRMSVRSNGGIANYSGNNSNLSDAREKTNVELAGSYLDKICAIPVKTFNYIDQNLEEDAGLTLGVIAQDVQSVAPELVTESNWAAKDEPEKMRLSIYQTDLQYALMKCIQEQQAIITEQSNAITALEARLTALEQV
jgi:hypothetical protein